jgi:hypothetical protein
LRAFRYPRWLYLHSFVFQLTQQPKCPPNITITTTIITISIITTTIIRLLNKNAGAMKQLTLMRRWLNQRRSSAKSSRMVPSNLEGGDSHDRALAAQRFHRRIAGFDAVGNPRDLLSAHEQGASLKQRSSIFILKPLAAKGQVSAMFNKSSNPQVFAASLAASRSRLHWSSRAFDLAHSRR